MFVNFFFLVLGIKFIHCAAELRPWLFVKKSYPALRAYNARGPVNTESCAVCPLSLLGQEPPAVPGKGSDHATCTLPGVRSLKQFGTGKQGSSP